MPNDLRDWTSAAGAPQRGLLTFSAPPNAVTTQTVSVSRGTHSVAILLNSLTNVNGIAVIGGVTGITYAANLINTTAFGSLFFVPVLSDFDNTVTVSVTMGIGAQTATVRIAEILDPQIVAIYQSNVLQIQGTGVGNAVVTDPSDRLARQLGRVVPVDDSNRVLIPSLSNGFRSASLGVGGALTILVGQAGQTTLIYKASLIIQAAAGSFGNVECPFGTTRAQWQGEGSTAVEFDFDGLNCGVNSSAQITNGSGVNTGVLAGHISFRLV